MSVVLSVLAILISIASLVFTAWLAHLEARYPMRERFLRRPSAR